MTSGMTVSYRAVLHMPSDELFMNWQHGAGSENSSAR